MTTYPSGTVSKWGTKQALRDQDTWISYIGVDGSIFYLAGPLAPVAGAQNGLVAQKIMGLMPNADMLELRGARQDGATWTDAVYEVGDIMMKLEASGTSPQNIRNVIRQWISSWDPRRTGVLSVFTPDMGEWWANVRQAKNITDTLDKDYTWSGRLPLTWSAKNYDAFWYSVDSVSQFDLNTQMRINLVGNPTGGTFAFTYSIGTFLSPPILIESTPSAGGGTFTAGTQWYKVTAISANGETTASNEVFGSVSGSGEKITVSWNIVVGATGYKLYRGSVSGGENILVTTTGASTFSYVDTNVGTSATPPVTNTASTDEHTDDLDWDCSAADVQAALQGLPLIGAGGVTVTDTAGLAPFYLQWYLGGAVTGLTVTSSLTGGTDPDVEITTTKPGGSPSGFISLTNRGDLPSWPRYLCYGPGTFSFGNGPGSSSMISFGPLLPGQVILVTTLPRLRSVVDLTPNQLPPQPLSEFQQILQGLISFATNNNVPPLLQQFESFFGILPPQGNLYSLLSGRFTNPVPGTYYGVAPETQFIPASITGGNANSKIVAALTPMRRWPL